MTSWRVEFTLHDHGRDLQGVAHLTGDNVTEADAQRHVHQVNLHRSDPLDMIRVDSLTEVR